MLSLEMASAFFAAALVLSLAPGPDNIFVLTQSALYGAGAGMVTTLGLATGLCVHTTAVALGVAVIFRSSPTAFWLLKILGACYLLYLAWLSFRSGAALARVPEAPGAAAGRPAGCPVHPGDDPCLFFGGRPGRQTGAPVQCLAPGADFRQSGGRSRVSGACRGPARHGAVTADTN